MCDSTPEKQGAVTPGSKIPVCPPDAFSDPYPDYALLFAWNHAEEIMAKESQFHEAADGGSCTCRRFTSTDVRFERTTPRFRLCQGTEPHCV